MYLYLNDIDICSGWGVIVSGGGAYNSAERDITEKEVLGRAGNIIIDNGRWLPCDLEYTCGVVGASKMDALRAYVAKISTSEVKIRDSFHPKEYYLGWVSGQITPTAKVNRQMFEFKLKFKRRPERFSTTAISYENYFSAAGTATLPSHYKNFNAPIKLTWEPEAAGTLTITHGSDVCTITATDACKIVLDAENWIASVDDIPCAVIDVWDTAGAYPVLWPDANVLSVSCAGAVSIEANPYTL